LIGDSDLRRQYGANESGCGRTCEAIKRVKYEMWNDSEDIKRTTNRTKNKNKKYEPPLLSVHKAESENTPSQILKGMFKY